MRPKKINISIENIKMIESNRNIKLKDMNPLEEIKIEYKKFSKRRNEMLVLKTDLLIKKEVK